MNNGVKLLLDIAFPRRCPFCDTLMPFGGAKICGSCRKRLPFAGNDYCLKCGRPLSDKGREFCPACEGTSHAFDNGRSLLVYDDFVRHSIAGFKYKNKREYADFYGEEICRRLGRYICSKHPDMLIPVPVSAKKLKSRGYNQAELIAKVISRITGIPLRNDVIIRERDTAPQKDLGRTQRQKNLKKAFKITSNVVELKTIMVIDDIYTTGSTMDEISVTLKSAGAGRVYFVTLAAGRPL